MNLRAAAASVILDVKQGHSLTEALPKWLAKFPDQRDQALVQAICYGVCRWYDRLNAMANQLVTKPLKEKDADIHCLLLVGLYQLSDMRIPEHAAVAETVSAVRYFKKIWAKNLVNAVLRQFIRQRESSLDLSSQGQADFAVEGREATEHAVILSVAKDHHPIHPILRYAQDDSREYLYSHPTWIITKLKTRWPDDWQTILTANNEHPPFSLRVNQRHQTRADYLAKLPHDAAQIIPETQSGIMLTVPLDVNELPGFAQGDISVQDGAAQLAAELLELAPHQRVLDACAAPGGKTAHILELQPDIDLLAIDIDEKRLQTVHENLARLHLSAKTQAADVGDLKSWWDGKLFDRILLDAPCSASGVIRRHPDIKLLRRETDIPRLAEIQLKLLTTLWPTLAPGGLFVYATCSIFPEENVDVLEAFLALHPEAKEVEITAELGKKCSIGRQILPGMHNMDGFYYARLRK